MMASKGAAACLAPLFAAVLAAGCAAFQAPIWPSGAQPRVSLLYEGPAATVSPEAAIGAIRDLQLRFTTFEGNPVAQLEVDGYGIRAQARWNPADANSYLVPDRGGYWMGNSHLPSSDGSIAYSSPARREETVIVPFDQVTDVEVLHFPAIPRQNRYGVAVRLEGGATQPAGAFAWLLAPGESVVLRLPTEADARALADAVVTLARAQGRIFPSREGLVGIEIAAFTLQQREDLARAGIPGGALVVGVTEGSPAGRAGMQVGDVLLFVDGSPVTGMEQCVGLIRGAGNTVVFKGIRRGVAKGAGEGSVPGWVQRTFTVTKLGS